MAGQRGCKGTGLARLALRGCCPTGDSDALPTCSSGFAWPSLSWRGFPHSEKCHYPNHIKAFCKGPQRPLCHLANIYCVFKVLTLCQVRRKDQELKNVPSLLPHTDAAASPVPCEAARHLIHYLTSHVCTIFDSKSLIKNLKKKSLGYIRCVFFLSGKQHP